MKETMQFGRRIFATALTGLGLLTLGMSGAHASPLIVRYLGTSAIGGGQYRYDYGLQFTTDEFFQTNDYFTIYDFGAFVSASTTQPNFAISTANLGLTPTGVLPSDDPTLTNITFKYTGAANLGMGSAAQFDTFSVVSSSNITTIDEYSGLSTQTNAAPVGNQKVDTLGRGLVVAAIPEPGTMALLAPALLGGLAVIRRRKA